MRRRHGRVLPREVHGCAESYWLVGVIEVRSNQAQSGGIPVTDYFEAVIKSMGNMCRGKME